jgi:hypothetical protein
MIKYYNFTVTNFTDRNYIFGCFEVISSLPIELDFLMVTKLQKTGWLRSQTIYERYKYSDRINYIISLFAVR